MGFEKVTVYTILLADEVLDSAELDRGPSNASISHAIDKPRNDDVFDAIEWDPGPQVLVDWK